MSLIHHALIGKDIYQIIRCELPTEYGDTLKKMPIESYAHAPFGNLYHLFITTALIKERLIPEYYREYYCYDTLSVERSLLFR